MHRSGACGMVYVDGVPSTDVIGLANHVSVPGQILLP